MTETISLQSILLLGLVVVRIGAAFALVPVFAPGVIPPTVRNGVFVGLALMVLVWRPPQVELGNVPQLIVLSAHELFVGLVMGVFLGGGLWAFQVAGGLIDRKAGGGVAQVIDPTTGDEVALNAAFFARLAGFVFVASGGLLFLAAAVLQSYVLAPISPTTPALRLEGAGVFEGEFQRIMALSMAFAAPTLIVLTLAEVGMGMVNRFAPQLNVFAASLSIKSWLATLIVLSTGGLLVQALVDESAARAGWVLHAVPGLQLEDVRRPGLDRTVAP